MKKDTVRPKDRMDGDALVAQRFDPDRLALRHEP